jgi:hypothetical protein
VHCCKPEKKITPVLDLNVCGARESQITSFRHVFIISALVHFPVIACGTSVYCYYFSLRLFFASEIARAQKSAATITQKTIVTPRSQGSGSKRVPKDMAAIPQISVASMAAAHLRTLI